MENSQDHRPHGQVQNRQRRLPQNRDLGERIGCGWSFETLDPENPDATLRQFTACDHCGRRYCSVYTRPDGFVCTNPSCQSTSFSRIDILSPRTLSNRPLKAISSSAGPLNTLADQPLGISAGTLFFDHVGVEEVAFANNSDSVISLPWILGPPWMCTNWSKAEWGTHVRLLPGATTVAHVRKEFFRPIRDARSVQLGEGQEILMESSMSSWWFHACWLSVGGVAFVHWLFVVMATFNLMSALFCAISMSVFFGAIVFLSPTLICAPFLLLGFLPLKPFRSLYSLLCGIDKKGGHALLDRSVAVLVVGVVLGVLAIPCWYLFFFMTMSFIEVENGVVRGRGGFFYLACLVYGAILIGVIYIWLRAYRCDLFEMIVTWAKRRFKLKGESI